MRERVRNILVGTCMIGALAAGSTLLFLFGELGSLVERNWSLDVRMPTAAGLRVGSLVTKHGVPVGRVRLVGLESKPRTVATEGGPVDHVRLELAINEGVEVPSHFEARVKESLFGGGATVDLVMPDDASTARASVASVWSAKSPPPSGRALYGRTQGMMDAVLGGIEPRLRKFDALADEATELGRNLNGLLAETKPGETPKPESIRETLARLRTTIENFDTMAKSANALLEDKEFFANLRSASANLDLALQSVTSTMNGIPVLLEREIEGFREDISKPLGSLDRAAGEIARLAADVRAGKGTIGRLVQDPVMHESLVEFLQHADDLVSEARKAIETLRSEGITLK